MALNDQVISSYPLSNRWQSLYHAAWYLIMAVAVFAFIAALPGYLLLLPEGPHAGELQLTPSNLNIGINLLFVLISISSTLLSLVLSWILFRQKSNDRMVAFISIYLIIYGVGFSGPIEALQFIWPALATVAYSIMSSAIFGPLSIVLIVLFPDGKFVPSWSRWLVLASIPMMALTYIYETLLFTPSSTISLWIAIAYGITLYLLAFGVQFNRYRNISNIVERQQIKWVVFGLGLWVFLIAVSSVPYIQWQMLPPESRLLGWAPLFTLIWPITLMILPTSLAISVLRFRLFDIDIIINRTLVYAVLTAIVLALYILVVGGLGTLFQTTGNTLIALSGTAVIAILFNPLRIRLQRAANRMMFGDRDEPFEVVRRLGRRLETSVDPVSVLPAIVETVTQTLKIPYAEITLLRGAHSFSAAAQGKQVGESIRFPLTYQNETIGYLDVSQRTPGEALSEADQALLRQIARQAGPTVQAVRLTQDLQASRVNLVTAREEERRRLRRDLHDGLGPVLASQGLKMAAASQLLRSDPKRAQQLLEDLALQNESTVAEVRRLVYELRPAALDELGLIGAVRDYASEYGEFRVNVEIPKDGLPDLPAAIEVAAYRVATEALTNVSRHAEAANCNIAFSIITDDEIEFLHLEVVDDGIGLPEKRKMGIGLLSMRERSEEIGGDFNIESSSEKGTKLSARLPLVS